MARAVTSGPVQTPSGAPSCALMPGGTPAGAGTIGVRYCMLGASPSSLPGPPGGSSEHPDLPAGPRRATSPGCSRSCRSTSRSPRGPATTASARACSTSSAAGSAGCGRLLRLATGEQAFFPEYGEGIPFRIENHAHLDPFGRSSLTARREIFFPGTTRIFQDTTSFDDPPRAGPGLVDYVGRYRRLVTDLNLSVTAGRQAAGRLRGVAAVPGAAADPAAGRPGCQGLRRAVVGAGGGRPGGTGSRSR